MLCCVRCSYSMLCSLCVVRSMFSRTFSHQAALAVGMKPDSEAFQSLTADLEKEAIASSAVSADTSDHRHWTKLQAMYRISTIDAAKLMNYKVKGKREEMRKKVQGMLNAEPVRAKPDYSFLFVRLPDPFDFTAQAKCERPDDDDDVDGNEFYDSAIRNLLIVLSANLNSVLHEEEEEEETGGDNMPNRDMVDWLLYGDFADELDEYLNCV